MPHVLLEMCADLKVVKLKRTSPNKDKSDRLCFPIHRQNRKLRFLFQKKTLKNAKPDSDNDNMADIEFCINLVIIVQRNETRCGTYLNSGCYGKGY